MVKKLIFCLVTFFLLMQITSAVDTEIKVKTLPNHEVQLTTSKANIVSFSVIENFKKNSDEYGDVMFMSSSDEQTFNIIIYLKKNNEKITVNNFTNPYILLDNVAGTPVYLELAPAWFVFIKTPVNKTNVSEESENATIENITSDENESEVFIETEEEIEQETEVQLAGSVIFGDKGFFSKKTIYYVIGIIVLLIGFMAVKTMRKKLTGPKEIKIKKLSEVMEEKKKKFNTDKEIIENAEKKIKDAQEDIRKIKNQDKIEQAKKKIIEDEKELMKLRQGKE